MLINYVHVLGTMAHQNQKELVERPSPVSATTPARCTGVDEGTQNSEQDSTEPPHSTQTQEPATISTDRPDAGPDAAPAPVADPGI